MNNQISRGLKITLLVYAIYFIVYGLIHIISPETVGAKDPAIELENISAVPHDKFVCLRIPICKENLADLENIVITALNLGTNRVILSKQDPALSFQTALPHIINSINISIFNRVWILTEGLPFCLMQGLEQHISEIYSGWETLYKRTYQHHKQCAECAYKELCPGTEVRYAEQFGDREFLPVRAGKCFQDIKVLYD